VEILTANQAGFVVQMLPVMMLYQLILKRNRVHILEVLPRLINQLIWADVKVGAKFHEI
jgi:hypothetical protein